MPRVRTDAIFFDMDGTLIDESRSYREAIRLTAARILDEPVSAEDVEEIKRYPGFNNDWDATWGIVNRRRNGNIVPPSVLDRAGDLYRRICSTFQTYYLGSTLWAEISGEAPPFRWSDALIRRERPLVRHETLESLSAIPLGIATSRPRREALMAMEQHGLDRYFSTDLLVAAEDTELQKPDPAPLLLLKERVPSVRPIYVGDSINDAVAAIGAGIAFVHIGPNTFEDRAVVRRVALWLDSVNDLPGRIELLRAPERVGADG